MNPIVLYSHIASSFTVRYQLLVASSGAASLSAVLCAVIYQTFCLFADSLLPGTLCTAHRLLFFYNKNLPQMAEIHSRSNVTGFGQIVGVHGDLTDGAESGVPEGNGRLISDVTTLSPTVTLSRLYCQFYQIDLSLHRSAERSPAMIQVSSVVVTMALTLL